MTARAAWAWMVGWAFAAAVSADPLLESRVARLERVLDERSLSDLVLQLDRLQQEVRELRGQVERQQYQLERLGEQRPAWRGDDRFAPRLPAAEPDEPPRAAPEPIVPETTPLPARALLPALPAAETPAGGEREIYRTAFAALKERDYSAAQAAFAQVLERYPRGELADNACYWLGEISYLNQDYPAALDYFNRLASDYPNSARLPGALLKIGYAHAERREWAPARAALQQVVSRFPDSAEGRLAATRLTQLLYEEQR